MTHHVKAESRQFGQKMFVAGEAYPSLGCEKKLVTWLLNCKFSIISIKRTVLLTVLFGRNEKVSINSTVHLKKNLNNEIMYCFY